MKVINILATIATVLTSQLVFAVALRTETTTKVFENAKLVKSVTIINEDNSQIPMNAVSHGIRKKAVFGLVPVNVYVLQLLAAKPEKLVKTSTNFLTSVKEAGPIQMHFTFLRDLPAEKISSSFKEGLEANGIQTEKLTKELDGVLRELSNVGEFKEGQSFSLTFSWNGENATVMLTDPSLKIKMISGSKAFADQLLSIWFGKTADSKLEELKQTMIR